MSDDEFQRTEVITGVARRRRWSVAEKLRIVEESFQSGETVSVVARRHGVAPNLLFRWRRLASAGVWAAAEREEILTRSEDPMTGLGSDVCTGGVPPGPRRRSGVGDGL